jgi:hypothetical protein
MHYFLARLGKVAFAADVCKRRPAKRKRVATFTGQETADCPDLIPFGMRSRGPEEETKLMEFSLRAAV